MPMVPITKETERASLIRGIGNNRSDRNRKESRGPYNKNDQNSRPRGSSDKICTIGSSRDDAGTLNNSVFIYFIVYDSYNYSKIKKIFVRMYLKVVQMSQMK